MPGGWHAAEQDDATRRIVDAAVQQQAALAGQKLELLAIDRLEQQVVAGMNYRASLRVRHGAAERRARAAVFRGLDGQVRLTDWQWLSIP